MPIWVLDTNVLVSGLLSPHGAPGRLVDALLARQLQWVADDRILAEYRDVLARPKFRIDPVRLLAFWGILPFQRHLNAPAIAGLMTTDPADLVFLEVAAASEQMTLVAGNVRHFPVRGRGPVRVLAPAEAVPLLTV
jgi:putative PIN family toxin of toxin-antitoxin system